MAISATITEYDGQTVDVTISEGVGPAGPEGPAGSVTNADINAAIATDPAASRSAMVVAEIKEVTLSTTPGDGAANVAAIQAALDNFSHVRLIGPGVAEVTDSVIVYANQTLEGDADLQLKKVGHFGAVIINEAAFTAGALDENITLRGIRIDADLTQ